MTLDRSFLFFLLFATACSRKSETTAADAATDAASTMSLPPTDAALEARAYVTASAEEAKRELVKEPTSKGAKEHYTRDGGAMPASFAMQTADLTIQGRRAILVHEAGKGATDARPFLEVVEADGTQVWAKDRPHAGITPPVGQLAIAAAPKGRVAQSACDPPTSTVALRLWDHDGFPFADFQALNVEACDELALLYWPKRGFVIVAARSGATIAQLLDEEGKLLWNGNRGIEIGTRAKVAQPPAVVVDRITGKREDDSFLLVQAGTTGEGQLHAYAFRYDLRGIALWQAALDLGPIPANAKERPVLRRVEDGVVAATLPGGKKLEIRSSGESRTR